MSLSLYDAAPVNFRRRFLFLAVKAVVVLSLWSLTTLRQCAAATWYKGIVHAHANWGVSKLPTTSPDVVVRWYREHNYNFVSITDLNYYTPAAGLKALFDAPGRFLVVPGTELSRKGGPGTTGAASPVLAIVVNTPPLPVKMPEGPPGPL